MRVKICGITRPGDAQVAAQAGADAVGLVFWAQSKRAVSVALAQEICRVLPPFVSAVGLFVNPEPDWVETVVAQVPLDILQFHGDESPVFCESWQRPYIKALRVESAAQLRADMARYVSARALLLDAVHDGQFGGTGATFDWEQVPADLASKVVLAGGLDADNVASGIQLLQPCAVDVSSGVESEPGIKDASKIQRFIQAARAAC